MSISSGISTIKSSGSRASCHSVNRCCSARIVDKHIERRDRTPATVFNAVKIKTFATTNSTTYILISKHTCKCPSMDFRIDITSSSTVQLPTKLDQAEYPTRRLDNLNAFVVSIPASYRTVKATAKEQSIVRLEGIHLAHVALQHRFAQSTPSVPSSNCSITRSAIQRSIEDS